MYRRNRSISSITISLLLLFSISQVYVATSFARGSVSDATVVQQPSGVLSVQGNQSITVNGVSAQSGATILPGAAIETPAGVSAVVNFGSLGSLQIAGASSVRLDFEDGRIKVTVLQGCVVLRTNKGTRGELETSRGVEKRSDGSKDDTLEVCAPGAVPPAPPGDTGGWLGAKVIVPLFAGTAALLTILAVHNDNPSPATP